MGRRGDGETGGRGDGETGRRGDDPGSLHRPIGASPRLRVSPSLHLPVPVPVSPCPRVPASPSRWCVSLKRVLLCDVLKRLSSFPKEKLIGSRRPNSGGGRYHR